MPVLRSRARRARAFTLIEVMIVVVMVGILALIAGVSYRKWVRSSYMGEAQEMLGNIRMAEESFRSENGGYLNVSPSLTNLYPLAAPVSTAKTAWGQAPGLWAALNVHPSGPVRFGYAVIAGDAVTNPAPPDITFGGASANYPAMAGQPWFVAVAQCDIDDDNTTGPTKIYASSGTNQFFYVSEGL